MHCNMIGEPLTLSLRASLDLRSQIERPPRGGLSQIGSGVLIRRRRAQRRSSGRTLVFYPVVLQSRIGHLLKCPVGRPPNKVRRFHANLTYQAGSQAAPGDRQNSSGIRASFIRASGSLSPTCRARLSGLSPSTTSAAHASNGSKKARARSSGHGYHAGRSWPTRFGFSFMRSPTISAIFCTRWRRPSQSRTGR